MHMYILFSQSLIHYIVYRSDELRDELDRHQESLRQVEANLDEAQGEKAEKLKELKAKEDERQSESRSRLGVN